MTDLPPEPPLQRFFLSYAKEDLEFAHGLYFSLKKRGFDPWMDKPPAPFDLDGLQPGEDWRAALEREIQRADRMILILSEASVSKVGYVQREFRRALELMNEMPPGRVFAVPILKEPCEVPALVVGHIRLQDLQWTNIFDIGLERFVDGLERAVPA